MRNLLKNKLIIITLIFLLLITNLTSVFATDTDVIFPDIADIVGSNYYAIFHSNYETMLVFCSSQFYIGQGTANGTTMNLVQTKNGSYTMMGYVLRDGAWVFAQGDAKIFYTSNASSDYGAQYIKYCNFDITDKSGNILRETNFFQIPPPIVEDQTQEITTTQVLAEILEQEKEQVATLQQIIQILPLTIVVVVSLVGLRKALKMLLGLLRNS